LNTATGTWSVSNLSNARQEAAATSTGNRFIVAGGAGSNGAPTPSVEIYTVTSTGLIPVQEAEDLHVFPNPVSGSATVELQHHASKGGHVEVLDCTGRLVQQDRVDSGQTDYTLKTELLRKGIYTIGFYSTDGVVLKSRIVVE
ncbi:MAG: T9SS type A sorting domain-containing protein, partial [Bacteroidota bacterium]